MREPNPMPPSDLPRRRRERFPFIRIVVLLLIVAFIIFGGVVSGSRSEDGCSVGSEQIVGV